MADMPEIDNPQPQTKKEPSLGAKLLLATGFAWVGAKISTLFTAVDVVNAVDDHNKTLPQKLKTLKDHGFFNSIGEAFERNKAALGERSLWNTVKAGSKTFKYSIVSSIVFMGGGAVLGWVRGDRVASAKDIFIHPLDSTKLVLGIGDKPKNAQASTEANDAATTRWRDQAGQRTAGDIART